MCNEQAGSIDFQAKSNEPLSFRESLIQQITDYKHRIAELEATLHGLSPEIESFIAKNRHNIRRIY